MMRPRVFFITYFAANVSLILYGALALVQPGILLEISPVGVYQFPLEAHNYLVGLYRLLGYFNIVPGLFGLLVLYRFRNFPSIWYVNVVVASTLLSFLGPITFDNTVGTIGFFEILEHILFLIILISGISMLVQGKDLTPQSPSSPLPGRWEMESSRTH